VLDGHEDDAAMPWHACLTGWCASTDHVSGSLINQRMPHLYSDMTGGQTPNVGFVIADHVQFDCAMVGDGGSVAVPRGGCGRCTCGQCNGWCVYRTAQLADFVRASTASNQYNEVVIPKDSWEELLPGAIRAVMCIRERASCAQARSVRERFLAAYQLDAASVPFVFYDQHDGFSLIV
jgi:hypothetical protein